MRNYKSFLLLVFCGSIFKISAQNNLSVKDMSTFPYWMEMINDSNVNYYEALKAYDIYWANHTKPAEEEDRMQNISLPVNEKNKTAIKEREKEQRKFSRFSKRERKRFSSHRQWEQEMVFHCKKFEDWKRDVYPWVQDDGSILTVYQRALLYEQKVKEASPSR